MSNAKQRITLTNLTEPQQMRELNRQLSWIWDQLLGGLTLKSLNSGTRAVIDSKASSETVDELGNRIEEISTEVVQTQEEISLKASREELTAVEVAANAATAAAGEAQSAAESAVDTAAGAQETAEAARAETGALAQRVTQTEAEIAVQADQISLRVTKTEYEEGLDGKLDADAPAVGVVTSGVTITEDQVKITSPETVIAIPGPDGETMAAQFDEDGLTAAKIICPNVAPMYDGPSELYVNPSWSDSYIENGVYEPGDCFRSLKDALASLSYKTVPYAVTIYLYTGTVEYGDVLLAGCIAAHGITIRSMKISASNYATLHGKLEVSHCLGVFYVRYIRINPPSGSDTRGILAVGTGALVSAKNCIIRGTGSSSGSYGMCADDGAKIFAVDNEIYNCECSLVSRWMGEVCSLNNKGNCVPYIENATARFFGTAPSQDSSFWYYLYGAIDVHQSGVTVNQGTASGTVSPSLTTGIYLATSTASYKGSGSSYRTEVGQGWWDGIGRIRGCMWFNNTTIRSNLSGRTIRSATLRLSMRSGVGRGASVTVELSGTVANSGASSAAVTKSYGTISTISPGEVTAITIPNDVITDLKNGTINGLMLYSSDTGAYKERSYSKNYAMFDGYDADDSLKPQLTIVYT